LKKSEFLSKLQKDIDRLDALLDQQKKECGESGIPLNNPFIVGISNRVMTLKEMSLAIEDIDSLE
jgi:hypothetical protein